MSNLFSGQWNLKVKVKSSLMKSPGLTGNGITSTETFKRKDCCPDSNVLTNNGGTTKTQPNKNGGMTTCDCTT